MMDMDGTFPTCVRTDIAADSQTIKLKNQPQMSRATCLTCLVCLLVYAGIICVEVLFCMRAHAELKVYTKVRSDCVANRFENELVGAYHDGIVDNGLATCQLIVNVTVTDGQVLTVYANTYRKCTLQMSDACAGIQRSNYLSASIFWGIIMVGGGCVCGMGTCIQHMQELHEQHEQFEHERRKHEQGERRKKAQQEQDEQLKKLNAHHEIEGDEIIENIENTDIERGRVEHLEHGEIESRLFY
jgi:hypothetical protein